MVCCLQSQNLECQSATRLTHRLYCNLHCHFSYLTFAPKSSNWYLVCRGRDHWAYRLYYYNIIPSLKLTYYFLCLSLSFFSLLCLCVDLVFILSALTSAEWIKKKKPICNWNFTLSNSCVTEDHLLVYIFLIFQPCKSRICNTTKPYSPFFLTIKRNYLVRMGFLQTQKKIPLCNRHNIKIVRPRLIKQFHSLYLVYIWLVFLLFL